MYTTIEDIILSLGGENQLPRVGNAYGADVDYKRIEQAILFATNQVNVYLTKPVALQNPIVREIATDLAIYRLADITTLSEIREKRYTASINLLKDLAKNTVEGLDGKGYQNARQIKPCKLKYTKDNLL